MPFIVESPGLSLAASVAGLHELVGEAHIHAAHGAEPPARPDNG
ncbi:hypothetical protein [Arthrobacter sp. YAF16]